MSSVMRSRLTGCNFLASVNIAGSIALVRHHIHPTGIPIEKKVDDVQSGSIALLSEASFSAA